MKFLSRGTFSGTDQNRATRWRNRPPQKISPLRFIILLKTHVAWHRPKYSLALTEPHFFIHPTRTALLAECENSRACSCVFLADNDNRYRFDLRFFTLAE
ncbi:hypothetical protein AAH450_11695 [Erwinia sp. P7711]|uniref:hypothetical protein n=1 Tax=Erwinia sp. P7711 TaxID=3141451 RepID=UPI00318832F2